MTDQTKKIEEEAKNVLAEVEDIKRKIAEAEAEIAENAEFSAIQDRIGFLNTELESKRKEAYQFLKANVSSPMSYKTDQWSVSYSLPSISYEVVKGADYSELEGVVTAGGHPLLETTISLEAVRIAVDDGLLTYEDLLDMGVINKKIREGAITIRGKK